METRICAADDCENKFKPKADEKLRQEFCSKRCGNRMRQKRWRERHRCEEFTPPPAPGGGGGGMSLDFHGEGLSIRREDDALPVIGPAESPAPSRKPPVPTQPQRSIADAA